MKKFLLSICLALTSLSVLSGCSAGSLEGVKNILQDVYEGYMAALNPLVEDSSKDSVLQEKQTYTITFKQKGHKDVVKTAEEGEAFTDIPKPAPKAGYTVAWDRTDFSNIREDLVVNAVETPNTYTLTYDVDGGSLETQTQVVTFDADTTLAVPEKEGYSFLGWYYNGGLVLSGKWKIADDVTLVAQWLDIREGYTISFLQNGCEAKVFTVKEGDDFTEIPLPNAKTGYTVVWDKNQFSNVRENITVTAIETPKTYSVVFNTNGGNALASMSVTYGEAYEISLPTHEDTGKIFEGWVYQDAVVPEAGFWTFDGETNTIELVAVWSNEEVWIGGH